MKICTFLDSNFIVNYEIHKSLLPVNESFLETYNSGMKPLESTFNEQSIIIAQFWFDILKISRKNNIWTLVRLAGRYIAHFENSQEDSITVSRTGTGSVNKSRNESRTGTSTRSATPSGTQISPSTS